MNKLTVYYTETFHGPMNFEKRNMPTSVTRQF